MKKNPNPGMYTIRNRTMPLFNNKSLLKNIYTLLASPSQEKKTSFKTKFPFQPQYFLREKN